MSRSRVTRERVRSAYQRDHQSLSLSCGRAHERPERLGVKFDVFDFLRSAHALVHSTGRQRGLDRGALRPRFKGAVDVGCGDHFGGVLQGAGALRERTLRRRRVSRVQRLIQTDQQTFSSLEMLVGNRLCDASFRGERGERERVSSLLTDHRQRRRKQLLATLVLGHPSCPPDGMGSTSAFHWALLNYSL